MAYAKPGLPTVTEVSEPSISPILDRQGTSNPVSQVYLNSTRLDTPLFRTGQKMSEGGARGRASRGRSTAARGRSSRGMPSSAQAGEQISQGRGGLPPAPAPQVSAWGPKPQAQVIPQVQQKPQQPASYARGQQAAQQTVTPRPQQAVAGSVQEVSGAFRGMQISGAAGASGERPQAQRRGAMRGKTEICAPMVTRPKECQVKKGTGGHVIKVTSNHFKLLKTTDWSLYQYRVDFSPEEDRTSVRKALLYNHKSIIGEAFMFDGSMLFTIKRLTVQQEVLELFSVRDSDDQKIRITIKFANELALGDYQYIQLFNIILRNCIDSLEFQLVGREYFDPHQAENLTNFKLSIWPGYVTSILQYETSIMMCIDVSHKVLRQDTVLELMMECRKRFGNEEWQKKFAQSILGTVVFTHYNNKPYRVDDVDFDSNPMSTFKKGTADIQYIQYYKEKYQINIREMRQPMLVSRPKARDIRGGRNQNIVLIPELCNMTGLSNEMRSNFHLMKAVADKTRIPPNGRINAYYQFMKRMSANQAVRTKQQQWNLKFAERLEEFPARRFDPETLIAKDKEFSYDDMGDWSRSMRGGAQLVSIRLSDWCVITPALLSRGQGQGLIGNFLSELNKAARSLKFEMSQPQQFAVDQDKPSSYYTAIERALSQKSLQLVMCIIPNNRTDLYSSIKKKCCVDRPVASQVIAVKTLNHKNLLSVATKICIQMNCKLGGAPWYVPIPFRDAQSKPDATMVVGFDVCHDTNMKDRSHGALVASLDYHFSKFYSAVSQHQFGEELSNDIATHLSHAVIRSREINNKLPARILIFRDGVGESNIPFVLQHEVVMIKTRLAELFPGVEFKLAIIIVSKRINTRVFLNGDNPKPGTVVDDVITQPEKYDFFIVSQSVKQGTVTPTSYNVIYDTTGLKPDFMQRITYKMTHLYYNCSATVRVPAQVQYAHKLAFLVGQAIHQCPSPDLNGVLYFL